jgi:hypothetical protein
MALGVGGEFEFDEKPQSLVDRFGIVKNLGHIGGEDDDVRALGQALRVPTSLAAREIVLRGYVLN